MMMAVAALLFPFATSVVHFIFICQSRHASNSLLSTPSSEYVRECINLARGCLWL